MATMSKKRESMPKSKANVLFMRLSQDVENALVAFQNAQRVKPDRTAIGLTALLEFLEREGYWPPKAEEG